MTLEELSEYGPAAQVHYVRPTAGVEPTPHSAPGGGASGAGPAAGA
jgi:hypothetical protein